MTKPKTLKYKKKYNKRFTNKRKNNKFRHTKKIYKKKRHTTLKHKKIQRGGYLSDEYGDGLTLTQLKTELENFKTNLTNFKTRFDKSKHELPMMILDKLENEYLVKAQKNLEDAEAKQRRGLDVTGGITYVREGISNLKNAERDFNAALDDVKARQQKEDTEQLKESPQKNDAQMTAYLANEAAKRKERIENAKKEIAFRKFYENFKIDFPYIYGALMAYHSGNEPNLESTLKRILFDFNDNYLNENANK